MRTVVPLRVSMRIGQQHYTNLVLLQATEFVQKIVCADRDGYQQFVEQIEKDQWLAGFCAQLLSLADRPVYTDWEVPLSMLRRAETAYWDGRNEDCLLFFRTAVDRTNYFHRKLMDFLAGTTKGAERAQVICEITNTTLVMMAFAPAAGVSIYGRAGMAAGAKLYQSLLTELGKVSVGIEGKLDVGQITLDVAKEVASTLIGGALAPQFRNLIAARVAGRRFPSAIRLDPLIRELTAKGLITVNLSRLQEGSAEYFGHIFLAMLAASIHKVAQRFSLMEQDKEKPTVLQFISTLLDDWGNDQLEIAGKALRLI